MVGSFVLEDGGSGGGGPAGTRAGPATSTTGARGFPPAAEGSLCELLRTAEVREIVGRPVEHPAIEPRPDQCAWPSEEGNPANAELFFVVKPRQSDDLEEVLRADWGTEDFRFEPADGLEARGGSGGTADEARFVVRRAEGGDREFVEGLDVFFRDRHVLLGNGARDAWEGSTESVKERLSTVMRAVLERLGERLDEEADDGGEGSPGGTGGP